MFGCQQILINADPSLRGILEFLCGESNKLHNCGTYLSRQLYFKTGKIPSKFDLHRELKDNSHFQAMYSHVSQQCLTTVAESFKSYLGLLKGIKKGTVNQRPKLPNYRKPGLNLVTFPSADVKLKPNGLRFPLGRQVKAWFGLDAFYLPMPSNLEFKTIREYRILPRNGAFYLELIYKVESVQTDVDAANVLGIDPGLNNWITCVSNVGTSFIVDGLHLKSLNQWYNKRLSVLKESQPQGFWSKQLSGITEKRNRQVRDAVNKAARIVLNHCIENRIGTVVFGWNKEQRQEINLGSKTNQKFVQIPTGRLKDRIAQLCERYNIQFVETEESYTSKASFLDLDELPTFGEKLGAGTRTQVPSKEAPTRRAEGWKESGKRVKRGLYRSKDGFKINADCNGAANILRKVAAKLGFNLNGVSRGALIAPLKVRIWAVQESPSL
ncbi:transposase, IS605 OrfB family [Lyngbya aestuarii BL J]|uniref:Transposase, IS605 OrfB family n=1 Tax=Lyngbya aestuarii BL J TaxID=1348334 RepID=U7QKD9_9CYAN|nr:RNA-guided endonuclease TnpB family protein [Lyngbya aestuarii]ERT07752.1 transposase, IS605 OrfB family [Lyngbya aestuarii BL J]